MRVYFLLEVHFIEGAEILGYKDAKVFDYAKKISHEFTNLLQKIHELMAKKKALFIFT
jgi:hypothetical protein